MEIKLERLDDIIVLVPGLYQFEENGLFEQAVIGLTEDEVVIYNDSQPDSMTDNLAFYSIKESFAISDVQHVAVENILHKGELGQFKRFNIILASIKMSFFFYYKRKNSKIADRFVKAIKKKKVNTSRRSVDMRSVL